MDDRDRHPFPELRNVQARASTLGGRANLCLVRPLSSVRQRLRGIDLQRGSLGPDRQRPRPFPSPRTSLICQTHILNQTLRRSHALACDRLEGWPQAPDSPPSFETHSGSARADWNAPQDEAGVFLTSSQDEVEVWIA